MRSHPRDAERGSVTPLIIGFAIILIMLMTVVVDASKVFLYKRDLAAAADGAALAAADGISEAAIYQGGIGDDIELSQELAEQKVRHYVHANGLVSQFHGDLSYSTSVSGNEVTVSFHSAADLPFVNKISSEWADGVPIQSEASATAFAEG